MPGPDDRQPAAPPLSPADAARAEAARQAVALAAGVLMIMLAAWAHRHASGPDAASAARMRWARLAERTAARAAAACWRAAEAARRAYERERP